MERPAEQGHPNGASVLHRFGERRRAEAVEPRPERHVGIPRHLRLQADEALDRVECTDASPAKQHLPIEERAVQRSAIQDGIVAGHDADAIAYRSGTYVVISTPVEVVTDSASLRGFFGRSRNSFFPPPRTIGMIISAYSSTRSFS